MYDTPYWCGKFKLVTYNLEVGDVKNAAEIYAKNTAI